jgi:hypothetical protein
MTLCKVYNCRFPNTHITSEHKCGNCKERGHGMIECDNLLLRRELSTNINENDSIEIKYICQIPNCIKFWKHTTEAHHCSNCDERHIETKCIMKHCFICDKTHSIENKCQQLEYTVDCPLCKKENYVNIEKNRIFGLDSECKICFDNMIEISFPDCKHACVCKDCLKKMEKIK